MGLKRDKDPLIEEVIDKEAYLVGLLWSNPELYNQYSEEKLHKKHFGNPIWRFYAGLGRYLYEKKKVYIFDDISVASVIEELNLQSKFDKFGGYEVVEEIVEEVKGSEENFEGYFLEIKKYSLLRELRELFGDRVLKPVGKYDYKKLSREMIQTYWEDKVNSLAMEYGESQNEEYDLLDDLEELVTDLDEEPDIGMTYYNSKLLNDITMGWALGTVSILSAFSGNGKTSWAIEKLIMGCITEKEKLLIIANEMDVKQYRKMLLITIMGVELFAKFRETFKKASFNRKNLNKGNFTEEEKEKLMMAVKWVKKVVNGKNDLVKFIAMEDYTMDNVETTVRYYARRGYNRVLVDTAKPSEGGGSQEARWERFVNDFDRLYKLARANGGGLNLALWATVQNADDKLNMRFLDERVIADGKKIKNTADVVFHMRPVWQDEHKDGAKELKVYRWLPPSADFNGSGKPVQKEIELDPAKVYYLFFTSKNRRGQTNITSLDVLVYEANFNSNRWKEVGWTKVPKDLY